MNALKLMDLNSRLKLSLNGSSFCLFRSRYRLHRNSFPLHLERWLFNRNLYRLHRARWLFIGARDRCRTGADQSRRGADQSRRGADQSRRGADQSRRGADQSRNSAQQLRRSMRLFRDETGSASVELVVFALPLFVPLILLATHLTTVSASKIELSHLARTSLRAFSSAESTSLGHARINQVLKLAESNQRNLESSGLSQLDRFSYRIECQRTPCIQPLNRLRLTLADKSVGSEITVTTSTDQWIEAESGFNYQDPELFFGYRDITDFNERFSPILEAADVVDQVRDLFGETK